MFRVRRSPALSAKSFPATFLNRAAQRERDSAMFSGYRSLPSDTEGGFRRCSFRMTAGVAGQWCRGAARDETEVNRIGA